RPMSTNSSETIAPDAIAMLRRFSPARARSRCDAARPIAAGAPENSVINVSPRNGFVAVAPFGTKFIRWSRGFVNGRCPPWPVRSASRALTFVCMRTETVLISGAGIAGPTLAFWLGQAGFRPTLVERAPALRDGGYVIDFWGLGFDIAERMGLAAELDR